MASNYYQIMGLQPMATTSEIKARYKELAKKHHPDLQGDTKTMSLINKAYGVLSDPKSRFEYNKTLIRTKNTLAYAKKSGIKQAEYPGGYTAPFVSNAPLKEKYKFWLSPVSAILMLLGVFSLIIMLNSFTPASDSADTGNNPPEPITSSSDNRVPIISITPKASPTAAPPTVAGISTVSPSQPKPTAPTGSAVQPSASQAPVGQTCSSSINASSTQAQQLEEAIKSDQSKLSRINHEKGGGFWFHHSGNDREERISKLRQQISQKESQLAAFQSGSGSC